MEGDAPEAGHSARDEESSLEASALSLGVQNTILDSVMETYVSPASA